MLEISFSSPRQIINGWKKLRTLPNIQKVRGLLICYATAALLYLGGGYKRTWVRLPELSGRGVSLISTCKIPQVETRSRGS